MKKNLVRKKGEKEGGQGYGAGNRARLSGSTSGGTSGTYNILFSSIDPNTTYGRFIIAEVIKQSTYNYNITYWDENTSESLPTNRSIDNLDNTGGDPMKMSFFSTQNTSTAINDGGEGVVWSALVLRRALTTAERNNILNQEANNTDKRKLDFSAIDKTDMMMKVEDGHFSITNYTTTNAGLGSVVRIPARTDDNKDAFADQDLLNASPDEDYYTRELLSLYPGAEASVLKANYNVNDYLQIVWEDLGKAEHDTIALLVHDPLVINDFKLKEQYIYGSSRLGMYKHDSLLANNEIDTTRTRIFEHWKGRRNYELSNHLGNVMVVVTDRKVQHTSNSTSVDYFEAEVVSETDYYVFGSEMVGRTVNSNTYRQGFNGKERDDDIQGSGNSYDFGARFYNTRLGRWFSTDILAILYPEASPYSFAANCPIKFLDPDGKKIINADRLRKEKAEAALKKVNETLANYQSTFTDIYNKKNFTGTKEQWKFVRESIKTRDKIQTAVTLYAEREVKTDQVINEWKNKSPNLFNHLDNMKNEQGENVDMMLGVENLFDGGDWSGKAGGRTATPSYINENGNIIPYTQEFGRNTINVTVEQDAQDRLIYERATGEYIPNHEGGHFEYMASKAKEYFEYLKKLYKEKRDINGGHNSDDQSGKKATEYGKIGDIPEDH